MASGRPAMWLLLATAGLLAIAAAPPTAAYHLGTVRPGGAAVSDTVTLPANNWTAYTFEMNAGDTLTYDIHVLAGTPIDLYIVPEVGLSDYANDTSVQFLEYADVTNLRNISGSFGSVTGVIGVILDNTDVGQGGVDPTGPVTVSVSLVKSSNLYLGGVILLACGVVLLVVAVVVALVLQRRKAAAPAPPPAPYGAPPVPYQAPPGPSPPEALAGPSDGPPPAPPENP